MVPFGATQESPYIKTEMQELHPEGVSQEDRAQGAWSCLLYTSDAADETSTV